MNMRGLAMSIGVVAGVAAGVLGQEAKKPGEGVPMTPISPAKDEAAKPMSLGTEKDPKVLMEKAKAAALAVKDIEAVVETTLKAGAGGADKASEEPSLKGRVLATFKKASFPLGFWRIERTAKGEDKPGLMAFDGANIQTLNHAKKELQLTPPAMGFAFPDGEESMLLPMWFIEQRMDMLAQLKPTVKELVLVEEAEIGGVKCAVLRQVREATLPEDESEEEPGPDGKAPAKPAPRVVTETTTVALARADALPRRVEREVRIKDGEADNVVQAMTQVLTEVKANANPGKEVFQIKAPEGYATKQVEAQEEPGLSVKVGDAALAFSLKDAAGKEYSLASLKGKVVLMDFWATWCGPCVAAMPSIQKLHEHFAGKPVAILGVNTWERKAGAGPAFMEKKKYTYPCLLDGDELAKSYGISGIPTLIVFDGEGKILHTGVGFGPDEEKHLMEVIEAALAKK